MKCGIMLVLLFVTCRSGAESYVESNYKLVAESGFSRIGGKVFRYMRVYGGMFICAES